jgi:hypothetical protein
MKSAAVVVVCAALCLAVGGAFGFAVEQQQQLQHEKPPTPHEIIDGLLTRSVLVARMLPFSRLASPAAAVNCSCAEYCSGSCFALQCGVCPLDTWSFPGGQSLCYHAGPLGAGLLCRVDEATGKVTQHACCNKNGPACFLPPNSCCSEGDCSTCGSAKAARRGGGLPSSTSLPVNKLYPPLNSTATRAPRRKFVNNTCMLAN